MGREWTVALVGPPNCGKTTIFNGLTGLNQQVGNYPGVTVERKVGVCRSLHGERIRVIDLPGTYSLVPRSPDEQVTRDVLLGMYSAEELPDLVLAVVDAAGVERQLPLVLQILELELPVVLVLNRQDVAEASGARIDMDRLSELLGGIPVLFSQANAGKGLVEIRQAIIGKTLPVPGRLWKGDAPMEEALALPVEVTSGGRERNAVTLLSDERFSEELSELPASTVADLMEREAAYRVAVGKSLDEEIGLTRMNAAEGILSQVLQGGHSRKEHEWTAKADRILLHRIWGWPIFAGIFFLLFWSVFSGGEIPSQGLEWVQEQIAGFFSHFLGEGVFHSLIVDGILSGVFGVLGFLPQILILFLGMGILESSGYMARAAFLMDGIMRKSGLPGRSFVPMLSGYACALPAMMATRTISNDKDRLLTVLVLPWVGCSARLPVFVLLVAVLFSAAGLNTAYQGLALFGLYAFGTGCALLAARLLRPLLSKEPPAQLLIELPDYQFPDFRYIGRTLYERACVFVKRMGTVIVAVSIVIWALSSYPQSDVGKKSQVENSYMAKIGKVLEPAFEPLGYDWRISTGILASFAAREVFNSHMSILLAPDDKVATDGGAADGLDKASSEEEQEPELEADDYEALQARFDNAVWPDGSKLFTPPVVMGLMVFFVFALQCFPSIAVTLRETGSRKWTFVQVAGMSLAAYLGAWITYLITGLFFS